MGEKAAEAEGLTADPIEMLRGLIDERFRLKFHYETWPVPTFALIVAKRGLKIHAAADSKTPDIDIQRGLN